MALRAAVAEQPDAERRVIDAVRGSPRGYVMGYDGELRGDDR